MAHQASQPDLRDPVPALTRGLALVRRLEADGPSSLERLSRVTGWPKSSVSRLLRSLELSGAVRRDPATKRYEAVVRIVSANAGAEPLREVAVTVMGALAEAVGHTVELYEPADGVMALVMVQRVEPEQAEVSARARVGWRRSADELDATAQVLLAHCDLPLPTKLWAWRDGRRTPVGQASARRLLQHTREKHVAVDLGINENGIRRYAAPIARSERLLAVLAIAQVCSPRDTDENEQLASAVREAAERIGQRLGAIIAR